MMIIYLTLIFRAQEFFLAVHIKFSTLIELSGANMFVFADLGPSLINDKTRCKSGLVVMSVI